MSEARQIRRRILKPGKFEDRIIEKTDGTGVIIQPKSKDAAKVRK